jgi:uncharacterized protein YciI
VAAQRDKEAQKKWISTHPEAARLGKKVLNNLGGQSVTAYGTNPVVGKLEKRKALVEKRMGGVKQAAPAAKKKKKRTASSKAGVSNRKREAELRRSEKAAARKEAAEERKRAERERKETAAAARREAAENKKAAREAKAQARKAKAHPSLFVVSLRYVVALEKIDAAMKKHVAFLDKHFAAGDFLVAGRQVPRTGGIILVRGKDRAAVERILKQDPFVKGKLASVDMVEFVASKMGKALAGWLKSKK